MAYKIIIDQIKQNQWEQYAEQFSDYNLYQTWPYQQVRSEMDGQALNRVVIQNDAGQVIAMCQVRIKHVKLLGLKIGYVQWGPAHRGQETEANSLAESLEQLHKAYVGARVNVLRIVPNIFADEAGEKDLEIFRASGFEYVSSLAPYHTMIFPLDISEEEMRSKLHRSWRRYLNKAEQSDIDIQEGTDDEYFHILEKLYLSALKRKGFKGLNPGVFVRTQQMLSNREKMNAVVAYLDDQPIAVHITSHLGNTGLGILAAVNEMGLQCGATYLVWWRTLLAAKRAGMKKYDLGGVDPEKNPKVFQFKSRMGSEEAYHLGAFEAYTNLRVKTVWRQVEKGYHIFKRREGL
jgi:lipid II:glycine glycyltransferase (peptidoglycan interpeptide bridge formation enzyme)